MEGGPTSGYMNVHASLLHNPATPQEMSSERRFYDGAKIQLPAGSGKCFHGRNEPQTLITRRCCSIGPGTTDQWLVCVLAEQLRSVLEDLRSLSAAVVNSSEDSAEEEEDTMAAQGRPLTDLT